MRANVLPITVWLLLVVGAVQGEDRPNVVFILIDDLRHDTFGFMDHPFIETPHLDALAEGGIRFSNAFVTTSLCSPSRASFLTGQYMHHHGVIDNNQRMPEGTQTFPQQLQNAGYQTAFIGKWHMGGSSDAMRPGFDHWVSFRGQGTYAPGNQTLNVDGRQVARTKYMTDELSDYADRWLQKQRVDTPFLLYLSHKGVHGLYDPAPRHRDRYRNVTWNSPVTMENSVENNRDKPMWVQDQRNSWHGVEFPYHGRAEQTIGQMYRHYCEMILSIDESVGRVMANLRRQGLDKNTVVVFTSDGGHLWGEHGLIDKRCAYEESMRIPLIVHGPRYVKTGTRCDALVANIDMAPTLLSLANVAVPQSMDGWSVVDLLRDPSDTKEWRDSLLYEYYWEYNFPQTPTTFSLRSSRFKLIQYHGIWDHDELYDLEQDPLERVNLIHQPAHQQRVNRMRRQLYEQLKSSGGLKIPMGFKRNHGASRRHPEGSQRSEFPERMLDGR